MCLSSIYYNGKLLCLKGSGNWTCLNITYSIIGLSLHLSIVKKLSQNTLSAKIKLQ